MASTEGGDGFVGPETYLGAEEMRNVIGENTILSILPATDEKAFASADE